MMKLRTTVLALFTALGLAALPASSATADPADPPTEVTTSASPAYFPGSLANVTCGGPALKYVVLCSQFINPVIDSKLKAGVARMWGNQAAAASWEQRAVTQQIQIAVCEKYNGRGYYTNHEAMPALLIPLGRTGLVNCLTRNLGMRQSQTTLYYVLMTKPLPPLW